MEKQKGLERNGMLKANQFEIIDKLRESPFALTDLKWL